MPQERTPAADALTSQDAVFKFETMRFVVEAFPVAVKFVKVEVAVVEVAVKLGAVMVLYAVSVFLKSALPSTSRMFPVVEVAVVPRRKTSVVSVG